MNIKYDETFKNEDEYQNFANKLDLIYYKKCLLKTGTIYLAYTKDAESSDDEYYVYVRNNGTISVTGIFIDIKNIWDIKEEMDFVDIK